MYSVHTSGLNASPIFVVPVGATYTTQANLDLFAKNAAEGDLGFFGEDNLLIATLSDGDKFRIAQKRTNKEVQFSAEYEFKGNTVKACNLVPAVNQEVTFTVTSTATYKGQRFAIKIFDNTEATQPFPIEEYEFFSVTGAETPTQIAAGIVANYNTIKQVRLSRGIGMSTKYDVTSAGAVITVESLDVRTHFEVLGSDEITGTIATVKPWQNSSGDYNFAYQMAFEAANFNNYTIGSNINIWDNWGKRYTEFVKQGCTYDIINLDTRQIEDNPITHPKRELVLPLTTRILVQTTAPNVSGSAAYTAIKTAFGL